MFSTSAGDEVMQFIREHSFLSKSVQAVGFRPLLTLTNKRFTSFALETIISYTNESLFVFYIGNKAYR